MYDDLVERLRYCAVSDNQCLECKYRGGSPDGSKMCIDLLMVDAADAIEERDKHALTLQHEMMAEAESHIALVESLNKQVEELQKQIAHWQRELAKSMCEVTLRELEKPCWIPVTEQPPLKVGDDGYNGYLVFANGYYEVADYTTDKFDNAPHFHVNGEYESTVTHFMPLPEPPKEEA